MAKVAQQLQSSVALEVVPGGISPMQLYELLQSPRQMDDESRSNFGVSCWHVNDHESAAMWEQYSRSGGIAIQSTVNRLCSSFHPAQDKVHIGLVQYFDYATEDTMPGMWGPILSKRKSFQHEQELRAMVWPTTDIKRNCRIDQGVPGVPIPVDIEKLVEMVYISPLATAPMGDVVEAITLKYGLDVKVVRSNLYDRPVF